MGKLRKIGKSIKKRVKKLFSSKLGRIIGTIAIGYMLGPQGFDVFGKLGNVFGTKTGEVAGEQAVQQATTEVAKEEVTKKAVEEGTKEVVSNTVTGALEETLKKDPSFLETFTTNLGEGVTNIKKGVTEFAADPIGKTGEYLGGDFVPDVARGVTTGLISAEIMGEPEEQFVGGGLLPQPQQEAAQNAYVQAVQNQIPQMQGMNFQQLNQSLLYGTLTPQFLMGQSQYT